jgi:AcrR family transcriptional regulator
MRGTVNRARESRLPADKAGSKGVVQRACSASLPLKMSAGWHQVGSRLRVCAQLFFAGATFSSPPCLLKLEKFVSDKQTSDRNSVKERIVKAAADLFMERGFGGTTVREIGERAGVGQSSLYHHARSKGQLLAELHAKHVQDISGRLEAIVKSKDSPAIQLRGVVKALLAMVHTHKAVVTVYLRESYALSDEAREEVAVARKNNDSIVERIIQRGIDSGEFRSDLDVTLTRRAILGMCNWAYQWYNAKGPYSIDDISEYFADLAEASVISAHIDTRRNAGVPNAANVRAKA